MAVQVEVESRPASCEPHARSTNKPAAALANPGHNAPILSPPVSSSSQYTAALDLDAAAGAASKSITTQSQTSSKRARAPSPRKTLRDLGMLDKPIEYVSDRSRLPPETLPHWQALGGICRDVKTIPATVAPRLGDEFIQEDMIDHDTDREGVELEYETLLEIHAEARQYADNGSHEAQWNTKVHDRILSCALRSFKPRFESINMSVSLTRYICSINLFLELQQSPSPTSPRTTRTTPPAPRSSTSPSTSSPPVAPLSNPPSVHSSTNPRSSSLSTRRSTKHTKSPPSYPSRQRRAFTKKMTPSSS